MVAISKVVGVMSCGFLLCVGLSGVASSSEELNTSQSDTSIFTVSDKDDFEPGRTVKGEVLRVEGAYYVVREENGKEVRMHVDGTTEKRSSAQIKPGDHVIAKVNAEGHASSFLTDQPIAR
jgi:ribosomal protein S1